MCSHAFRPTAFLQYEHMFCSSNTPPLARRLLGGLHLIRSFLLLEDDYDVDWEVDQDEPVEPSQCRWDASERRGLDGRDHPHRLALRSRLGARRPGAPASPEQVCVCPVGGRARAGVSHGSSPLERSCADG